MKFFGKREPRPAPLNSFTLHYVRTGEYERYGLSSGPLIPAGREQALAAAAILRRRIGDEPFVVFAGEPNAYLETSEIIASALRAEIIEPVFRYHASSMYASDIQRLLLAKGIRHVVMVENGSQIGDMLRRLPGPCVQTSIIGPEYGSVHSLEVELERRGGVTNVVEKQFLDYSESV